MAKQILVALDGTRDSERMLSWVTQLARATAATVRLLMVRPMTVSARHEGWAGTSSSRLRRSPNGSGI